MYILVGCHISNKEKNEINITATEIVIWYSFIGCLDILVVEVPLTKRRGAIQLSFRRSKLLDSFFVTTSSQNK